MVFLTWNYKKDTSSFWLESKIRVQFSKDGFVALLFMLGANDQNSQAPVMLDVCLDIASENENLTTSIY
jgi:hypothetical protein